MREIEKVLVANRGEIARRIIRTLRAMGIGAVAVYSDPDREAPHVLEADEAVRIGGASAAESYLSIEKLVEAAARVGADAVHPGYGFLSENAGFAEACEAAGFVFIGPQPACIRAMGSKIEAKGLMEQAGVPVIPGFAVADLDGRELQRACEEIGYPVLVKASAGGGGRGMRVVHEADALTAALEAARRESQAAFGDDSLLLERFFESSRHVEMQILGDTQGSVVHLFERECSLQRRHQKVIEETPSPALDQSQRDRMGEAAIAAARALHYVGAGTVEFLLDPGGDFFFLEVNTRLQVEHPVTEAVLGLDLVRLQIEVACGRPLPFVQADLALDGHAIEARLYAEDPREEFLPSTGRLALWSVPRGEGLRCDSGVERDSTVTVHYDPLLAKLIAHGSDREQARRRLVRALRELVAGGVVTNRAFLVYLLTREEFAEGRTDTAFIDRHLPEFLEAPRLAEPASRALAVVAAVYGHERRRREADNPLPRSIPSGWRNNPWSRQKIAYQCGVSRVEVGYAVEAGGRFAVRTEIDGEACEHRVESVELDADVLVLEIDGLRRPYQVRESEGRILVQGSVGEVAWQAVPRFPHAAHEDLAGGCVAPMTGVVRKICVAEGARVKQGELLLVLEAMKMEHQLHAHCDGLVSEVRTHEGAMVDPDDVLIIVEGEEEA